MSASSSRTSPISPASWRHDAERQLILVAMVPVLDTILVLVLVEAAALVFYHQRTRAGIAPGQLLPNLAAGFFLMLAARLALGDPPRWALPACLLAGLLAHLADMAGRWRRGSLRSGLSDP